MFLRIQNDATDTDITAVCDKIRAADGLKPEVVQGVRHTIITVVGHINGRFQTLLEQLQAMPGVQDVERIGKAYQLAARKEEQQHTTVNVGHNVHIGSDQLVLVAGPCSIESEAQLWTIAESVREHGAHILRGGAYKPRTGPRQFEGLGRQGLKLLRRAGEQLKMPTQTEVMEPDKVSEVSDHADILQIGARNMQNFPLLDRVGKTTKPVVLKRGPASAYEEWFLAAERILDGGNPNVILCERGIRGFDSSTTRNQTDIPAISIAHGDTHLPVMFDPSHSVGKPKLIPDTALAGVAAGADALHLEVHHDPPNALTDGAQALRPEEFALLAEQMRIMHQARLQCRQLAALQET